MRKRYSLFAAAIAVISAVSTAGCGNDSGLPLIEQVRSAGVLKVGTEGTYSPFSFQGPDGRLTGYDVEVAEAVGRKLGARVEFVQAPWDSLFPGLRAKRFDVIADQVTLSRERKARYDMSTPYTTSGGVIVAKSDNRSVRTLADLKGRKSAQSITSSWAKIADEAGAKVVAVEGFVQAVHLVKADRVDATLNDSLGVTQYLERTGDTAVRVVGKVDSVSAQAFAARKNSGLIRDVDLALAALRADGTLKALSNKYFHIDVSGI